MLIQRRGDTWVAHAVVLLCMLWCKLVSHARSGAGVAQVPVAARGYGITLARRPAGAHQGRGGGSWERTGRKEDLGGSQRSPLTERLGHVCTRGGHCARAFTLDSHRFL